MRGLFIKRESKTTSFQFPIKTNFPTNIQDSLGMSSIVEQYHRTAKTTAKLLTRVMSAEIELFLTRSLGTSCQGVRMASETEPYRCIISSSTR